MVPGWAAAQSIQTDFDRGFDFGKLKTYGYAEQPQRINDPLAGNPINDKRVRAALDSQLAVLGYKAGQEQPDFLVSYYAATTNKLNIQEWGFGPGRLGGRRLDVSEYTEGTLVVDLVDASTRMLIWRGSVSGAISPKEAEKKIRGAVAKLMRHYDKETHKT